MADKKKPVDADEAIARAWAAAGKVKPKDEAQFWATMAQTLLLQEVRDTMREQRTDQGSVDLPEEAPPRETARVTVVED